MEEPPTQQDPNLTSRWLQPGDGEGTRRDAILAQLRDQGRPLDRDLRGIDLAHESLPGVDLSGCDLSGAHLARTDLQGANLSMGQLRGAVLFGADLTGCELLNADLRGADLGEAVADRAGFGGANLDGALLLTAKLADATFGKASLRGADLRACAASGARFREADLGEAMLAKADLRRCDLEAANLRDADLQDVDLRGARLKGVLGYERAAWVGSDIRDVDFCGAYLVRRHIMDANFLHEFRRRGTGAEVLYRVWWITSDCGRSFTRWALWTVLVAALFAGLYSLVAIDYGDHQTWLSPLYYSIVTLTTLGYGDVLPASVPAQVLVMIEVVIGYVALGGLLSIFANKMARRAE